jgi:hypothetical protein
MLHRSAFFALAAFIGVSVLEKKSYIDRISAYGCKPLLTTKIRSHICLRTLFYVYIIPPYFPVVRAVPNGLKRDSDYLYKLGSSLNPLDFRPFLMQISCYLAS